MFRLITTKAMDATPFHRLSLLMLISLLPYAAIGQTEPGLYDMAGNRLYHLVKNGKKHTVDNTGKKVIPDPDPRKNMYYHESDLIASNGETYYFDYGWDQIIHNGKVLIEYNFNRRRYEWVEHQNIDASRRTDSKDAARIYTRDGGFKSPEHGDIALLTYENGFYYDEFGNPAYQLRGSFPGWANILLFHNFYEQHYTGAALDSVLAIRKPYRDSLNNAFMAQNTLVKDMLALGDKYKKTASLINTYKIVYFTRVEGQALNLSEAQVLKITNNWLELNPDTFRNITPHEMPEAGHFTKKKEAKSLGIPLPSGPLIIWEIKIKPEFAKEFKSIVDL